jgi:hypothetical protein
LSENPTEARSCRAERLDGLAGSRLAERGIARCHVRLKFLTWNLMVMPERPS